MDRQELRTKKIGVMMGGFSSEREISLRSGNAIFRSLIRNGYKAVAIDVDRGIVERLRQETVEVAAQACSARRSPWTRPS